MKTEQVTSQMSLHYCKCLWAVFVQWDSERTASKLTIREISVYISPAQRLRMWSCCALVRMAYIGVSSLASSKLGSTQKLWRSNQPSPWCWQLLWTWGWQRRHALPGSQKTRSHMFKRHFCSMAAGSWAESFCACGKPFLIPWALAHGHHAFGSTSCAGRGAGVRSHYQSAGGLRWSVQACHCTLICCDWDKMHVYSSSHCQNLALSLPGIWSVPLLDLQSCSTLPNTWLFAQPSMVLPNCLWQPVL